MKRLITIYKTFILLIFSSLLLAGTSCKKDKCGCEGGVAFEIEYSHGIIEIDEESKTAVFKGVSPPSQFPVCDAEENWERLTRYPGKLVYIWGRAHDDCMKAMNPYMYANSYEVHIDSLIVDPFNND